MKYTPSNKILLVIPFWERDRAAALGLSHLLADLQPNHSDDIDILFVARFDAEPVDRATVTYVSRKFNTMTHISRRKDTGWPAGCSGLFFGAMEFVYHKMSAGSIPGYKAIFVCEADTIPLTRDCFAYLHRSWDALVKKQTLVMAGALVPDGGREHINGGAVLITGNLGFLKWLVKTVGGMRAVVGWDFGLAGDFKKRGWSNVVGIRSFWNTPTMSIGEAARHIAHGVVWLHGVKDPSLLRAARELLV